MKHLWKYWLEEPIFLDDGVMNILKRKEALSIFCREGLIPLLHKKGYQLKFNDGVLYTTFVKVVFTLFCKKKVIGYPVEDDYAEEQYNEYVFHLDSLEWESFWEKWGGFQDFQENAFAHSLQSTLPELLWTWIDLDASSTAVKLRRELEQEEEYEEGPKGKDDPYLAETSKRDYQDRHW